MNRLVPSRPPLARVRRHVGALPHGLPTALLFTAAVAALMLGSFVVVDRACPVPDAARRRPGDSVGFEPSMAMPPPVAFRAVEPATMTASPASASPRPDPTVHLSPDRRAQPTGGGGGRPSSGGSNGRTVSFRRRAASPSPTAVLDGGRDRATREPDTSEASSRREDDERGPAPTPTVTPVRRHRWAPSTTPRPTSRPSPTPNAPEPTETPEWPTPNLRIESRAPAERPHAFAPRGDPAS